MSSFNNSDYLLKPNDQIIIEKLSNKMYEKDLQIIGFVKNPGQKTYREGMTVFDLIFLGGGFQNEEHLGDTYLPRADLYRYNRMENKVSLKTFSLDSVLSGGGIGSELVEMGDKIVIYSKNQIAGKIMQDVGISGFVKLPGKYEYVEDMFLSDLLFIASGFEDKKQISKVFTGRADINRFNQDMISKTTIKLNLANILNDDNDFSLKPGDEIVIYSDNLFKNKKFVTIHGKINNPGQYDLHDEMNLADLILKAGGFSTDLKPLKIELSNKANNYTEDIDISSFGFSNNIGIYKIIPDDPNFKRILNDQDIVSVYSKEVNIFPTATITGQVMYPGLYVLEKDKNGIKDLIERAGGLTPYANLHSISVNRNKKN